MSKFAQNTSVPVSKSRQEIETIVTRYGASKFLSGLDTVAGEALIGFQCGETQVRLTLNLPKLEAFAKTETGRRRKNPADVQKAHEQGCRSAWRSLALVVKAKFEAVESGISAFEEEFLANVVVPGGKTVGQTVIPQLGQYTADQLPRLLPASAP